MEVKFKVIEVKEINAGGKKFNAYKTIGKGGRKMDIRFTRECNIIPKEPCVIVCEDNKCNVDTTRQYPILWIKEVIRIEDFERKNNIKEWFEDDF